MAIATSSQSLGWRVLGQNLTVGGRGRPILLRMAPVERGMATTRILPSVLIIVPSHERSEIRGLVTRHRYVVPGLGVDVATRGRRKHIVSGLQPVGQSLLAMLHLGFSPSDVSFAVRYGDLAFIHVHAVQHAPIRV